MAPARAPIPIYQIDLGLPPTDRYTKLATDFGPRMQTITPLFDEVLASVIPWAFFRRFVEFLSSVLLRRVFSSEETQELKGIAKASGVGMYILVALNVLLDSLLGCTSGGALTQAEKGEEVEKNPWVEKESSKRMMHFRTLDWGMDELRSVLVVLEFVNSKSETPTTVIGRTVTYAGFVGVLTGVKKNLSLSLNFRPNHNCSTFSLRLHQILVLFAFRPSVVSVLRTHFLTPLDAASVPLEELSSSLAETRTAPCYLILCSGIQTVVIEKDLLDGKVRFANDFIVHTNHDLESTPSASTNILGMREFLEESEDRRACMQKNWSSLCRREDQRRKKQKQEGGVTVVREKVLQGWVKAYPITNECTHFGCILDPKAGTIPWLERDFEGSPL